MINRFNTPPIIAALCDVYREMHDQQCRKRFGERVMNNTTNQESHECVQGQVTQGATVFVMILEPV
jgi:hypothetical protein